VVNLVPSSHEDLLQDSTRAYAYLATVMPDGSPQLTPVWFSSDGAHILVNSARGRVKDKNMSERPRVAILVADPKDPHYRYVQIRGRVVEITEEGALDHIGALSLKYRQRPWTPVQGQIRVIYKILPESVTAE
jgi:PPOX class probable F420-dependent enzyme